MDKTPWKLSFNPDYLGSYALEPNKDLICTIKSVCDEEVYDPSCNSKKSCLVAHFEEKDIKPMILNVTNCKTIEKIHGSKYREDWLGKPIAIYIKKVKAFGDIVEALRIRERIPSTEKIICKDCNKEITPACGKNAKELAAIAVENCGRELCLSCMQKEKARMEAEKSAESEGK